MKFKGLQATKEFEQRICSRYTNLVHVFTKNGPSVQNSFAITRFWTKGYKKQLELLKISSGSTYCSNKSPRNFRHCEVKILRETTRLYPFLSEEPKIHVCGRHKYFEPYGRYSLFVFLKFFVNWIAVGSDERILELQSIFSSDLSLLHINLKFWTNVFLRQHISY